MTLGGQAASKELFETSSSNETRVERVLEDIEPAKAVGREPAVWEEVPGIGDDYFQGDKQSRVDFKKKNCENLNALGISHKQP